jgi:hypothetical protein
VIREEQAWFPINRRGSRFKEGLTRLFSGSGQQQYRVITLRPVQPSKHSTVSIQTV